MGQIPTETLEATCVVKEVPLEAKKHRYWVVNLQGCGLWFVKWYDNANQALAKVMQDENKNNFVVYNETIL